MNANTLIVAGDSATLAGQAPLPMFSSLSVGDVVIGQHDGLFSLNDLHQASGNARHHAPAQWLRTDQALALSQALENVQICTIKSNRGRNGGTYACKELVYAYAMWISPQFQLRVIQAFDALARGDVARALAKANTQPARSALDKLRLQRAQREVLENAKRLKDILPDLSDAAIQAYTAANINEVAGLQLLPFPTVEPTWSATELGKTWGVSATAIGRIANENGLKAAPFACSILTKAANCERQVTQWRYTHLGVGKLKALLGIKA
ncbi:KilA-N domain-containing protein [Ferrimonas balearica]|uniref:KilA-N domain-containing protein n=1 Tax=Ferrimonas balearica TaxID=44012 RepID=UPI001C997F3D|nr:KilA-N domain-containing protein [Ferrimonas balearica]MBY5920952.1 KilA-N domain-containing protein [Ferrimonas balearica]MBY5996363.1 KilA-N domain-containing protein [Ferrimonas balearica]